MICNLFLAFPRAGLAPPGALASCWFRLCRTSVCTCSRASAGLGAVVHLWDRHPTSRQPDKLCADVSPPGGSQRTSLSSWQIFCQDLRNLRLWSMVSGDDPNAPGPQQYTLLTMLGRHVRQKLGGHAQFSLRSARSRKATPPV